MRLLKAQLDALDAAGPEADRKRLELLDRIALQSNAEREFEMKKLEAGSARSLWRSNTPFVIAITGIMTIAANFVVSYLLKDQEAATQILLDRNTADLTAKTVELQKQIDEAKAESEQERTLVAREIEFQYAMVERIMSSSPSENVEEGDLEKQRARQLRFLSRIGLLSLVKPDELEALAVGLVEKNSEAAAIGFPTLPRAQDTDRPAGSKLSPASRSLLNEILGPPGTVCPVPLVDVSVPFEMVVATDTSRQIEIIRVHEAAVRHFRTAFALIAERGLEEQARLFGGTYAPRNIRGTSTPSIHAWGVAIDIDPMGNALGLRRGRVSMTEEFARTMEEAGFLSLGLATDRDWMSFDLSAEALEEIRASGYVPDPRRCG